MGKLSKEDGNTGEEHGDASCLLPRDEGLSWYLEKYVLDSNAETINIELHPSHKVTGRKA